MGQTKITTCLTLTKILEASSSSNESSGSDEASPSGFGLNTRDKHIN